ncbi:hypothetical protein ACT014_30815, partial [Pseudomonas aeruginosa]|uniref:hypothetical protein n=1 Tax=Pseudomonas aeruginosa TaxID=287 RepID=UPI00402BB50E
AAHTVRFQERCAILPARGKVRQAARAGFRGNFPAVSLANEEDAKTRTHAAISGFTLSIMCRSSAENERRRSR